MTKSNEPVATPTRRPPLFTLLPSEEFLLLINSEPSGLSEMFEEKVRWRTLVTDTSQLSVTSSPGTSGALDKLQHTLEYGPKIHQCLIFIHMETLKRGRNPCSPGDRKLLELCKEKGIPTLVVLMSWMGAQKDTGYYVSNAWQDGLIGQLIELQLPKDKELTEPNQTVSMLRQMQYVTGIEMLIGEQFDYLPNIIRNDDTTASIVCNV